MSRTGPRPHVWKVQGDIPHKQYLAFLQMRAQANYRKEEFNLSFEEFQAVWRDKWDMKGRGVDDYCLTREDPEGPWDIKNVICLLRVDHLRRQKLFKQDKKNGKHHARQ